MDPGPVNLKNRINASAPARKMEGSSSAPLDLSPLLCSEIARALPVNLRFSTTNGFVYGIQQQSTLKRKRNKAMDVTADKDWLSLLLCLF